MWDEYHAEDTIDIPLNSNFHSPITPTNELRHNEYVNEFVIKKLHEAVGRTIYLDNGLYCYFTLHYTLNHIWLTVDIKDADNQSLQDNSKVTNELSKEVLSAINKYIRALNESNVYFLKFFDTEDGTEDESLTIFNGFIFGAIYYLPTEEFLTPPQPQKINIRFEEIDSSKKEIIEQLLLFTIKQQQ